MSAPSILIADIGGTNARVGYLQDAWTRGARIADESRFKLGSVDFDTFEDFVRAALERANVGESRGIDAVFSVAGPVTAGRVHLTNLDWPAVEEAAIREAFGFRSCRLVNDLVAAAYGVTAIPLESLGSELLQAGDAAPQTRRLLLNVGTGLGAAYWSGEGGAFRVDASEAGHMGYAPATGELDFFKFMQGRYGRVSWERALSGPGLVEIHEYHAGRRVASSSDVVTLARAGDEVALRSLERFSLMLGVCAGDLALGAPALGGVWLLGGVVNGLGELFRADRFLGGFRSKGRMEPLLRAVPVYRITEPRLGLTGAWRIASEQSPAG